MMGKPHPHSWKNAFLRIQAKVQVMGQDAAAARESAKATAETYATFPNRSQDLAAAQQQMFGYEGERRAFDDVLFHIENELKALVITEPANPAESEMVTIGIGGDGHVELQPVETKEVKE